ncbi:hypothetical protein FDK33_15115 [Citrobacter werkmanii]|nr:hypothetical protein F0329_09545 [Citrobacter werkmanii]TKU27335.1 hypothetical protein FDX09_22200 [Citrobacter sp. wls717]TKU80831.1 hypothetical protein FDW97_18490 [Citrobacter sp. wls708]TKU86188.1 hypothetical protein FDX13_05150 [Citrobacter sp. wls707]MBQ4924489.1 hypothetical protein [Citrobacter werkmanii]
MKKRSQFNLAVKTHIQQARILADLRPRCDNLIGSSSGGGSGIGCGRGSGSGTGTGSVGSESAFGTCHCSIAIRQVI